MQRISYDFIKTDILNGFDGCLNEMIFKKPVFFLVFEKSILSS